MKALAVDRSDLPRLLAQRRVRLTAPRRAVLELLAESREPLTVAEIHERLGARRAHVVSIYRAVNLLTGSGLVRLTDAAVGSRGRRRYELAEPFTGHHQHLICVECGRIENLAGCIVGDDALRRIARRAQADHRFRVAEHELRLFGRCHECDR